MAKVTSTKSQKSSNPNPDNDDLAEVERAIAETFEAADVTEAPEASDTATPGLSVFNARVDDGAPAVDLDLLVSSGEGFSRQLVSGATALEEAVRGWVALSDQLTVAKTEIERLRGVELDRGRLDRLYAEEKTTSETLRTELDGLKTSEAAQRDRATKLEEVVEQVKERAFEIHNALQEARASEQKLQAELGTIQSKLLEFERLAQDETSQRVALEDRNSQLTAAIAKFEADDAEARNRLEKLTADNKVMATQVPKLLADRDNWQKQFAASERENARMLAERKGANERISSLEEEIRVLRGDIASLSSIGTTPTEDEDAAADGIDELDLAASLDRAFSNEDDVIKPDKKG